jgi:hypothetical protein
MKTPKEGIIVYSDIDWEKAACVFEKGKTSQSKITASFPSTKDVLNILAAVGTIGFLFACPKAASQMLGNNQYKRWKVKKVFSNLSRQKDIEVQEHEDGSQTVRITKQGMVKALRYKLDTMKLQPRRWDGKWRVVLFDIPEKHKKIRDVFRMRLIQLSLYMLQDSVFASPYPCFDEIEFLRSLYHVQFNVIYVLADKIEDDTPLRQHFQLEGD